MDGSCSFLNCRLVAESTQNDAPLLIICTLSNLPTCLLHLPKRNRFYVFYRRRELSFIASFSISPILLELSFQCYRWTVLLRSLGPEICSFFTNRIKSVWKPFGSLLESFRPVSFDDRWVRRRDVPEVPSGGSEPNRIRPPFDYRF